MEKQYDEIFSVIKNQRNKILPPLNSGQKEELIKKFHPDYSFNCKTRVSYGANKNEYFAKELVSLLEKRVTYPSNIDKIKIPVLVIGGGAGITAAIQTSLLGLETILITKDKLGASNTALAQGGMAAAIGNGDSPEIHAQDTLDGGKNNNPLLVDILTKEAPEIIKWLENQGMKFDKEHTGNYILSAGGGHSQKRILTNKGRIGPPLIKTLIKTLKSTSCIIKPFHQLVDLIIDKPNKYANVIAYDITNKKYIKFLAKAVILATGGIGALQPYGYLSTNHFTSTGEGLAIAYKAGVKLVNMDSLQFHPTGILWPAALKRKLASEKLRSLGAGLFNKLGEPFINPLETRNVVTAAIIKEIEEGRGVELPDGSKGVWLDIPNVPEEKLVTLFTRIDKTLKKYGYNPKQTPLLISPVQHYQNGGILIDESARTTIPGLWAAGEITGGIHGINRLGGNALTDILVFGRRAGKDAASYIKEYK